MKRLFSYVKDYKLENILGPLFKMLEANFELFVPLVVARMVDVGIRGRDSRCILKMGGVLVLLALIGLTCSLTAQYFAAKAATGTATSLRSDLFFHIGRLSYTKVDTVGMVALITKMTSDINQVQSDINMTLHLLLQSPFVVFGAMVMAFTVDVHSTFVFAVTIPILCIVVFGIMAINVPLCRSVQRQLDEVLLTTRGNLLGIRAIRAFNRQKSEAEKFDRENGNLVRIQVFMGKVSALLNPVTYVIINIAVIAVIWVGAERVNSAVLTRNRVVVLVDYMSQILVELIEMVNLIIIISKAVACINRVDDVSQVESSIENRGTPGMRERKFQAPKIEFKDMEFVYAGTGEPALQDTSSRAMAGQIIGVIGGTRSGKSTLVNLIPRFYDAASRQVLVDRTDVEDYPLDGLREKMGVTPQKSVLFRGTPRDNMYWGKQDALDEDIYRALDTAQARKFVDSKGEDLGLYIDQGGHNLSGGQHQRLIIARALVREPEILIMDDSTSVLDYATDIRLEKAIRESTGDMTIFIVSQRTTTTKDADTILVPDERHLAGMSTHKELLKDYRVYREICLSQLSKEEMERDEQ